MGTMNVNKIDDDDFRFTLSAFQKKGLLTDVCLLCDGGEIIRAHKLVLASRCQYFYDIFTAERENNAVDAVGLQGVTQYSLQPLVDFIYTGTLELPADNMKRLWSIIGLATKFKMKKCSRYLRVKFIENLQPETFSDVWQLVSSSEMKDFQAILINYLVKNCEEICRSSTFLDLDLMQIHGMFDKCSKDHVPVPVLQQCLRKWMDYKKIAKCDILEAILEEKSALAISLTNRKKGGRHGFVRSDGSGLAVPCRPPTGDCCGTVAEDGDCQPTDSIDCSVTDSSFRIVQPYASNKSLATVLDMQKEVELVELVINKSQSTICKEHESGPENPIEDLDKPSETADLMSDPLVSPSLVIVAMDSSRNVPYFVQYSINDAKWSTPVEVDIVINQKSTLRYYRDRIYSIGGADSKMNILDECYVYDLMTKSTKKLPQLRNNRFEAKVEVFDNTLFVLGGKGKCEAALRLVEYLDLNDVACWNIFQPMRNSHLATAASFTTGDHIFVLGGGSNCCEYYSFSNETWHRLPPLPDELVDVPIFAAFSRGQLMVLRSFTPSRIYGLRNRAWRSVNTKGCHPDNILRVANYIDCLYAITPSSLIFVLNFQTASWSMLTKSPHQWSKYLCFDIERSLN